MRWPSKRGWTAVTSIYAVGPFAAGLALREMHGTGSFMRDCACDTGCVRRRKHSQILGCASYRYCRTGEALPSSPF
jgi:hypothetical protein